MATKKATPAQLAARARFAEMARSGEFKKRKNNPMQKYTVLHRGTANIAGEVMATGPQAAKQKIADKLGIKTLAYLVAKKTNQAAKRSAQRKTAPNAVVRNPIAKTVMVKGESNYPYSVEAKRMVPGGSFFEPIAGFKTKIQAQDYANAILASHPKITLRIKTYK